MKKILLITFGLLFYTYNFSQTCSNPPSIIQDPGFDNINNGLVDWFPSHGSPSIVAGYNTQTAVWLWSQVNWSCGVIPNRFYGEGIYTCFNFDSTKCYDLSFFAKVNDSTLDAKLHLYAVNNLTAWTGLCFDLVNRTNSFEKIAEIDYNDLGNNWRIKDISNYMPNANYSQIVIFPEYINKTTGTPQVEISIDSFNIYTCCTNNTLEVTATDTCVSCIDTAYSYNFKHTKPQEYIAGQAYVMDSTLEVTWGPFSNDTIRVSADSLCSHDSVKVCFDLYVIGSWDGRLGTSDGPDIFGFNVDGQSLLYASFSNSGYSQSYPNNSPAPPGGNHLPHTGSVFKYGPIHNGYTKYEMCFNIPHTSSMLSLDFLAI